MAAQRWQMHAAPLATLAARASSVGAKEAVSHQQRVAKRPDCAGAQAFGPPQSGQA